MRVEQQSARRGTAPVVITTVLSLLVVAAAVAAVAWLVFRTPSDAVDSAERLEPIGTALPAPTEQPTLPTPIPTVESEPAAPGFTGEAPEVSALPTVAAPQEAAPPAQEAEPAPQDAGPTPTPRVVALPTAPPPTQPPAQPTPLPAPTLPPAVPVEAVPVVALEPVGVAAPAPTAAADRDPQDEEERERRSAADGGDDDPFDIFGDGDGSRIVPAQNDAMERVRAMQDDADDDADSDTFEPIVVPAIEPAEATNADRRDGSTEIVVPDVQAMIDEITTQVVDPNRNPNVGDAGREDDERDQDRDQDARDRDGGTRDRDEENRDNDRDSSSPGNRARGIRERINDRFGRDADGRSNRDGDRSGSERGDSGNNEDPSDDCFPFC